MSFLVSSSLVCSLRAASRPAAATSLRLRPLSTSSLQRDTFQIQDEDDFKVDIKLIMKPLNVAIIWSF